MQAVNFIITSALLVHCSQALASQAPGNGKASEEELVSRIKALANAPLLGLLDVQLPVEREDDRRNLLTTTDQLLARFPKTSFKDDALIMKLEALAQLARIEQQYLDKLLGLNDTISTNKPSKRLAAENDYYAIQAFVLAARLQEMSQPLQLLGKRERYNAFIADHAKSPHVPVIRASLIRTLLAMDQQDGALLELQQLSRDFPKHPAVRRAGGELSRALSLGRLFHFEYSFGDNAKLSLQEYAGDVVVMNFWSIRSKRSLEGMKTLRSLYDKHHEAGLVILGINVDSEDIPVEEAMKSASVPWPLFFDRAAFSDGAAQRLGVISLPTYFVIDRKGFLVTTNPGLGIGDIVQRLIDEKP